MTGVNFVASEGTFQARASREVILSCGKHDMDCHLSIKNLLSYLLLIGTIQTPQLLELSGIGNATLLRSIGISPLLDLPSVGENLQVRQVTAKFKPAVGLIIW